MMARNSLPAVQIPPNGTTYIRFGAPGSFRFETDGNLYATNGGPEGVVLQWLLKGAPGDVEILVNPQSGNYSGGAPTGVWLNLGTTRQWTLDVPVPGPPITVAGDIQLRHVASAFVLANVAGSIILQVGA